jgi:hypothetical protein
MREKSLLMLLALALLLVACAVSTANPPQTVTQAPFSPVATTAAPNLYPPPGNDPSTQVMPAYPGPNSSIPGTPSLLSSGFEPQPGDAKLMRDQVLLNLEDGSLVVRESLPPQVSVNLNGTLPDPCHQLRVVVAQPNAQREIMLDVYSVYDPNLSCIMVIKPFSASIPLGTYSGGNYKVFVNGQLIGDFNA